MKPLRYGDVDAVHELLVQCSKVQHGFVTEHAEYLRIHMKEFHRSRGQAEKEISWRDVSEEYSSLCYYLSDIDAGTEGSVAQ